jgi:hypothetical protein
VKTRFVTFQRTALAAMGGKDDSSLPDPRVLDRPG